MTATETIDIQTGERNNADDLGTIVDLAHAAGLAIDIQGGLQENEHSGGVLECIEAASKALAAAKSAAEADKFSSGDLQKVLAALREAEAAVVGASNVTGHGLEATALAEPSPTELDKEIASLEHQLMELHGELYPFGPKDKRYLEALARLARAGELTGEPIIDNPDLKREKEREIAEKRAKLDKLRREKQEKSKLKFS